MKTFPFRSHLRHLAAGFSLVEVVIALGIVSFALVATLGLLPVGLDAQKQAASYARSVQALSELSDNARGVYLSNGGSTRFPYPLEGLTPGTAGNASYALLANGKIASSGNDVLGRIFVRQYARTADGMIPVYLSVAWPAAAERSGDGWKNAQGSVESLVFVNTP